MSDYTTHACPACGDVHLPPTADVIDGRTPTARLNDQMARNCVVCDAPAGSQCRFTSDHPTDAGLEPDERLRGGKKGEERPVPHFYR